MPDRPVESPFMLVGPGLDGPSQPETTAPSDTDAQSRALARRIVVAFVLVALLAIISFFVLPAVGLNLPIVLPVSAFALIVIGTVMSTAPSGTPRAKRRCNDEGCAVGCCQGPRPPSWLRE